jgi:transcriptional regulator with XRE-family HTH domain
MTQQGQLPGAPPVRLEVWIRDQRRRLGYSQSKLARLIDTDEKNVRNWEKGRNRPSLPLLLRLHVLFGVPLPYSLDDPTTRVWLKVPA